MSKEDIEWGKRLRRLQTKQRVNKAQMVQYMLDSLILMTPTSEARNLLTEANLKLMEAMSKPEFKELT